MAEVWPDFQKRVKRIAFTDSVHNFALQRTGSGVRRWMASVKSFVIIILKSVAVLIIMVISVCVKGHVMQF